jgi:SPP1 family predicted phage head-tail adaptor
MESGKLRQVADFQKVTETRNSHGGIEEDWTTFKKVRVSLGYLRGSELFAAQQINTEAIIEVRCRYFPGLDEKMRIVINNKELNIVFINNVNERNREYRIICSTGLYD